MQAEKKKKRQKNNHHHRRELTPTRWICFRFQPLDDFGQRICRINGRQFRVLTRIGFYNTRCHTFFIALEMSDFKAQKSSNLRKHFQQGLIRENLHITFRLLSKFFLSFGKRSRVEIALQKKRIVSYSLILVQKTTKKTVRAWRCVTFFYVVKNLFNGQTSVNYIRAVKNVMHTVCILFI